ncbi:MAG: Hpt domain-containing protein [Flavobacteriales bacterium]
MTEDSNIEFDLSYLNQVFQGNKQMINNIISMFIKQVPEYIHEMEECVVRAELEALHPLAHKAKSSVAMLGLKNMEQIILEIEHKSRTSEDLEALPSLVRKASVEVKGIASKLEKVLKE